MFWVDFSPPGPEDIPILLTLVLLEAILSFDNAAVLAALTNRLPREQRRKALLYGIVGAYFFRILAIVFVAFLLQNIWLQLLGAAYLIYLAVHHYAAGHHIEDRRATRPPPKLPFISAFWSTVVFVELTDIAFALDQIVVAVALVPDDITVIIIAAMIGIVFLRLSAYYIGRLMEWFPTLETLAYTAVGFVGLKMVVAFGLGHYGYHIPHEELLSIVVTLSLIVAPPLVKFVKERFWGAAERVPERGDEHVVVSSGNGDLGKDEE